MRYKSPVIYLAVFYALLAIWTIYTAPLLYGKFQKTSGGGEQLFAMLVIAFIYLITWYWSLGTFYRIELDKEGTLVMKSLRRTVMTEAAGITKIEGPVLPLWLGFVRFRLAKDKEWCYLLCMGRIEPLREILQELLRQNPYIRYKRIHIENRASDKKNNR